MTNCNSTQHQENDRTIHFACVSEMYQLHADATPADVRDQLEARLSQLRAMLIMTTGNGFENFNSWADPIKHNYLWACSMLVDECDDLVKHV